jgi:Family of unknown function (DUF6447)
LATLKIDQQEFDMESLSPEARQQLEMVAAAEARIRELQRDLALMQTARNAYLQALKALLPTPLEQVIAQGDTLKLG